MLKIIPLLFLSLGIFLLLQVILPLAAYKIWETQNLKAESLLMNSQGGKQILGISIKNEDSFPLLISEFRRDRPAPYSQFLMSIPSLKIDQAKVLVDTNNLNGGGLSHLPGSALPGEKGNIFISGHSALPQVFKGEKNYGSIFANLNQLKDGDGINISAGADFKYQVIGLRVVDPKDLSVIVPPDSQGRYLTLMTCVPPGLNVKRLIVLAKLI